VLRVKDDIKRTFLRSFIITFVLFLLLSYTLVKQLIISEIKEPLLLDKILSNYNFIWILLLLFALFLIAFTYFLILRLTQRVQKDIDSNTAYLEEINSKKYDGIVKIEHYIDFLKMSLLLKNIAKRLKQKEKKAPKK